MQEPEDNILHLMELIPDTIEPGASVPSYRELVDRLQAINRQRLLIELDEIIEQNRDFLSFITVGLLIKDRAITLKGVDLRIDAEVDEDQRQNTLKEGKRCMSEIVKLLERYCIVENGLFVNSCG